MDKSFHTKEVLNLFDSCAAQQGFSGFRGGFNLLTKEKVITSSPAEVVDVITEGGIAIFRNYKNGEEFFVYEIQGNYYLAIVISPTQKGYASSFQELTHINIIRRWAYSELVIDFERGNT